MEEENDKTQKIDEIQEWLDNGNKITILPYYGPKGKKRFGRVCSKTKRRNTTKGLTK